MKDKQHKTIKSINDSPAWTHQGRDEKGRWLSRDGLATGKRIYTQADLDREIAQAFLSGTKQAREVVEIVRPDLELLRMAFMSGMNESKNGLVTPSKQFERWMKRENLSYDD